MQAHTCSTECDHNSSCSSCNVVKEPLVTRLQKTSMIAMLMFILYFFAQEFEVIPNFDTTNLTFSTAFLLGLFASASTCMATSGALFLSTVGKLKNNSIVPAISFVTGRVLSYTFFGFLLGFVGKAVTSQTQLQTIFTFLVSAMMIYVGLNMIQLNPFGRLFSFNIAQGLLNKLETHLTTAPQKTSFLLGALTYYLPCGFTQTVQLYALSTANPTLSALMMMIFALGTTPALLAVGFASSLTKTKYYATFTRVIGILIIMIGVSYVTNTLNVVGTDLGLLNNNGAIRSEVKDGYQVVHMRVTSKGYEPNAFALKKNIPVKWEIEGENIAGCQSFLTVPKLGIQKVIQIGKNLVEFTPKDNGNISFACSMNMFRGTFTVM